MRLFVLTAFFLSMSIVVSAQVIHVPIDQPSIQDGLNAASFGDTVLVAPGTYFENITWPNVNGIKLIAEGDTSDTFVDGGGLARCFKIAHPSIDSNTVLLGFTLLNGMANDSLLGGGGLVCYNCSPIIDQCRITQNVGGFEYGIGALLWNSNSIIRNSSIDDNSKFTNESASLKGVGVAIVWGSQPTFRNVNISNNHFIGGVIKGVGLMIESNCHLEISNSIISNNTTECGYEVFGVGVYLGNNSSMNMDGCLVEQNKSLIQARVQTGIGIYGATMSISNSIIQLNHASAATEVQGGAILAMGAVQFDNVQIIDNTFEGGSSYQTSGLISMGYGESLFSSVKIMRNSMNVVSQYLTLNGMVLSASTGTLIMENCLIAENSPTFYDPGHEYHGLIKLEKMDYVEISNTTIANNFHLLNNSFPWSTISADTTTVTVLNSIVYNPNLQSEIEGTNITATYSDVRGGFSGTGNIDSDPMFIGNGDYHLQTFSPCINSGTTVGTPLTDIEGNPRPMPVGTNPDMGAYEDDNPSTGVNEVNDTSGELTFYPNPSNGLITFANSKASETIELLDINGSFIRQFALKHSSSIDLSDFASGIYLIRSISENGSKTQKLILAK